MAAGAGDHLMLNRLGLGEDNAETAGSSTVLVHESVVREKELRQQQLQNASPPLVGQDLNTFRRAAILISHFSFLLVRWQVNAVVFLQNGLLATAAGKVVAMWDVNACAMKHTLNHEGTVRRSATKPAVHGVNMRCARLTLPCVRNREGMVPRAC
jgi:hypothetical protein